MGNKVPTLRFPEFTFAWKQKKISDVFFVNAGGDIEKEHVSQLKTNEFKYPIYANAAENKGFYAYSDIYKIEPPVVTVAGRGVNIGIAHARDHKFYPIVRLLVLKPKEEQDIFFFEYRINTLNVFVESTGVPQLTAPQISNYKVTFPDLPEQIKIAKFLTAVDQRINLLQKKKTELERYKAGVMQKIFNQEISSTLTD
jgi:type I restriction enzyme S subunit